ncbi:MAG: hypothetical protein M3Q50_03415 [Chloroflexota bacterium]|nr:hypothetical protein [Chloroflexia bacterium]MDQ3225669.1 hypothetical protein [Chloroflexota bacterium]
MDGTRAEILGALIGAIAGALGATLITRWSILFERKTAALETVQALADEARFNAKLLRHRDEHDWDFSPSGLERQAFDAALPVLHVLPPDLRDDARDARSKVLYLIYIETMLAEMPATPSAAAEGMVKQQQTLLATLPDALEALAANVETFVAGERRLRWLIDRRPR